RPMALGHGQQPQQVRAAEAAPVLPPAGGDYAAESVQVALGVPVLGVGELPGLAHGVRVLAPATPLRLGRLGAVDGGLGTGLKALAAYPVEGPDLLDDAARRVRLGLARL